MPAPFAAGRQGSRAASQRDSTSQVTGRHGPLVGIKKWTRARLSRNQSRAGGCLVINNTKNGQLKGLVRVGKSLPSGQTQRLCALFARQIIVRLQQMRDGSRGQKSTLKEKGSDFTVLACLVNVCSRLCYFFLFFSLSRLQSDFLLSSTCSTTAKSEKSEKTASPKVISQSCSHCGGPAVKRQRFVAARRQTFFKAIASPFLLPAVRPFLRRKFPLH